MGFFSLIRLVFSPEGRTFALELFRQILSCWSSCATLVLFVEWTTMLGSFSFLAIRKHVSMSQSTSAGSAAQPAPTKRPAASLEASISAVVSQFVLQLEVQDS